jgi:hypothetical protein
MFCNVCGNKIPDDVIFCPYCGAKVVKDSQDQSGSENQEAFNGPENHENFNREEEHWTYEKARSHRETSEDQNFHNGNQNARSQDTWNYDTGNDNNANQNTSNQDTQSATNKTNKKPLKPLSKNAKILIGAAAAVIVVIILAVSLYKPTVNLSDYVTIEADGYDTLGTASATFDFDQFYEDHENTIKKAIKKQPGMSILSQVFDIDDVIDFLSNQGLLSAIEAPGSLDKDSGLSNGDTITYSFSLSDSDVEQIEDELGLNIKYEDITYEVSGLEEVESFDPFELITVEFSGDDGNGVADVTCEDPDLGSLIYITVDPSYGLSNGDKVEVSIEYGDDDDFLDYYGKLPSKTSETIEVSGLTEDVSGADDISDDAMDQMKNQSEDLFTTYAADSYGDIELKDTEYLGYYLLINKSDDSYLVINNAVVLIYKLSVSLKAEDDSLTDYQYYAATEFDNLTVDGDGNTVVDVTDGYIIYDDFSVEVEPEDEDAWTTTIYLRGYQTLEDMYDSVVNSNLAEYTVDDHLDVEIDDQGNEVTSSSDSSSDDGSDDLLNNDYILPDSASRELTDADVEGLTLQEINYAKNEIYARHGRKFDSQELQDYFNSKSWYSGTIDPDDFSDDMLSSVEKKNAEFLHDKELEMDPDGYQLDAG